MKVMFPVSNIGCSPCVVLLKVVGSVSWSSLYSGWFVLGFRERWQELSRLFPEP
jgi:hypothetical protein